MYDVPQTLESILPPQLTGRRIYFLASHNDRGKDLLAFGIEDELIIETADNALPQLQNWLNRTNDWAFGSIAYDLKNGLEDLHTRHPNRTATPVIHFIRPLVVIEKNGLDKPLRLLKGHQHPAITSEWMEKLNQWWSQINKPLNHPLPAVSLKARISRDEYLQAIERLQHHIQQGDIYEINYCQEYFAQGLLTNPFAYWQRINHKTLAPFSAYIQTGDHYLLCASPERFLKRENNTIISQPIKGTIRRGTTTEEEERLKHTLAHSVKEQSENVMIVDLVRNDLSKSAKRGTVEVKELFGVYTFKTVHHLISTIQSEVDEDVTFTQLIHDTFPMGSMTGAPKLRSMQLADEYEYAQRGLYSGSIGYITPQGDFDFNVVIRSLVYNERLQYMSCSVGGAITALSQAQQEYEECLLKAQAILESLQS